MESPASPFLCVLCAKDFGLVPLENKPIELWLLLRQRHGLTAVDFGQSSNDSR